MANMENFSRLSDVAKDVETLAILVNGENVVAEEMALDMKSNYDNVQLVMKNIDGHEKYGDILKVAIDGDVIDRKEARGLFEFQRCVVKYRATH